MKCNKKIQKKNKYQLCRECFSLERYNKICLKCGTKISRISKLCVNCQAKENRKIKDRPSREQLFREIAESSYCAVGRKYGVSDNAIRKRLN